MINTVWIVKINWMGDGGTVGFFETEREAIYYCEMKNKKPKKGNLDTSTYWYTKLNKIEVYE